MIQLIYFYGFDSSVPRRREELTNNKEAGEKGTFYSRIRLIDIFGFADQDKDYIWFRI